MPGQQRGMIRGARQVLFRIALGVVQALPDSALIHFKTRLNIVRRMDYARMPIYLAIESHHERNVRLRSCEKEPETVHWIEQYISRDDVVYDVGANVGAYAILASKIGAARVYAFEPGVANFAQLSRNIVLNGCQGKIVPLPVALTENTGLAILTYSDPSPGAALHALKNFPPPSGSASPSEQPVLACRLDDLIRFFALEPPTHLKIDVDGTEETVLRGAEATLRASNVKTLMVELKQSPETTDPVVRMLTQLGYEIRSVHVHEDHGVIGACNCLFIRSSEISYPR